MFRPLVFTIIWIFTLFALLIEQIPWFIDLIFMMLLLISYSFLGQGIRAKDTRTDRHKSEEKNKRRAGLVSMSLTGRLKTFGTC